MKLLELGFLSRQLELALASGAGAPEAVRDLSAVAADPGTRRELDALAGELEQGVPLSEAAAARPTVFAPPFAALVQAGEASGRLAETMGQAADYFTSAYRFKRGVVGSLLYPIICLLLTVPLLGLQVAAGVWTFFPRLNGGQIADTTWLQAANASFFVLTVAALAVFITPGGRRRADWLMNIVPPARRLRNNTHLEHLSRMAGALVRAGMPVHQALAHAANAMGSSQLTHRIKRLHHDVETGADVNAAMQQLHFPAPFGGMLRAGIARDKAGTMLGHLAHHYREINDCTRQAITTIAQPIALAVTAAVICLFILNFGVAPILFIKEVLR